MASRASALSCGLRIGTRVAWPAVSGHDDTSATTAHITTRSREVTPGMEGAPAGAMPRAIGMRDEDFAKPQIAVASSWNEVTPCNMPLDRLAKRSKVGVRDAGGYPIEFVTVAVSDGISMGHEGMRAS